MEQETKSKAIVWFTGVISKYNLADSTFNQMKINTATLTHLKEQYDLVCIICIPDEETKQKYLEIIKDRHIEDNQYVFIPYQHDFDLVLESLIQQVPNVTTYIDYSKARLVKAAHYLKNENVIHISQLLN